MPRACVPVPILQKGVWPHDQTLLPMGVWTLAHGPGPPQGVLNEKQDVRGCDRWRCRNHLVPQGQRGQILSPSGVWTSSFLLK